MDVLMDKKGVCWFAFYVSRAVWIVWSQRGPRKVQPCQTGAFHCAQRTV
mgnify:CR=1 FL=1